jgi:polysaccharide chain length determinant protein (PEP-CTERM system associated)
MREILDQIVSHVIDMWRYRWFALAAAWLVSLAGWTYVCTLPDVYQSMARVQVDTESLLEPLLRGLAIQTDAKTKLDMMTKAILTRPNLEKLARDIDMDLKAKTASNMETLIHRLKRGIWIQSGRGRDENVYTISYNDTEPQMSQRVVQALVNVLVENTLGDDRRKTSVAQRFLEQQVKEYAKRLGTAENRLAEFKKKYVGMMPRQGQDYYARLQAATAKLAETRAELRIAEKQTRELRRQLAGEEPVFGLVNTADQMTGGSEFDSRIQEYQSKLDELSLQYTEKHPDIIALRKTISELEQRRQQEQQTMVGLSTPTQPLEMNPVYQSMKIALSEAEVQVATLRARAADEQKLVDELKDKVDTIPEVEANLQRLNRDYGVTKNQYDALLQRLETARLSEEAEQSGNDIEFRVIEPPSVPEGPAGPDRRLFNSTVLIGGLLGGLALAFLLHQINPVFNDVKSLHRLTAVTVLGAVSMKLNSIQKLKCRVEIFSLILGIAGLVMAYGGTILFEEHVLRLANSLIYKINIIL